VNLFAYRATDPKELLTALDPIGPENDQYIQDEMFKHRNAPVIAAWGANKYAKLRAKEIIEKYGPFSCLQISKDGSPYHPLYVKSDTKLIRYPAYEQQ
jgi:hypothetical protein